MRRYRARLVAGDAHLQQRLPDRKQSFRGCREGIDGKHRLQISRRHRSRCQFRESRHTVFCYSDFSIMQYSSTSSSISNFAFVALLFTYSLLDDVVSVLEYVHGSVLIAILIGNSVCGVLGLGHFCFAVAIVHSNLHMRRFNVHGGQLSLA